VTSHLDADVLADYREGLLGERRSARIREHLAACAQCSSLDAGLAEVTALLAGTPTPPMPEHLVARLENALAIEAAGQAKAPGQARAPGEARGAGGAADGKTGAATGAGSRWHRIWRGQSGPGRASRQWSGAVLGAAAVIVLILVVGGVYGLATVMHQNSPSSASSGRNPVTPGGVNSFASRAAQRAQGAARPTELPAGSLRVIDSGTDYQPGTLAGQVESLLNRGYSSSPGHNATPVLASPRLLACVTLVTGGVVPRLVDVARYRGQPATVIVQAAAAGKPAQVWVVGSGCSAGQRDVIAHTEITPG
jgi:hypothetical protein